jgi:hypothetical protein
MARVGDTAVLRWEVINDRRTRVAADVVATVVLPSGTSFGLTVTSEEVGRFKAEFVPNLAGRHVVRWSATGAWTASLTDVLNVEPSADSAAIISLAEAREHMNIPDEETVEDDEIRSKILAASGAVELHLGIVVARRTLTERFTAITGQPLRLRPPVVEVLSAVDAAGDEVDVEGWQLDGFTGFVTGAPAGTLDVTYRAGLSVIPQPFIEATQIVCAHLWATQRANTFTPRFGDSAPAIVGMGYALPNRAMQLLGGRAPNMP